MTPLEMREYFMAVRAAQKMHPATLAACLIPLTERPSTIWMAALTDVSNGHAWAGSEFDV